MRELNVSEMKEVNGGELTPSEGAVCELAVAGVAASVGAPVLAIVAIVYAVALFSLD